MNQALSNINSIQQSVLNLRAKDRLDFILKQPNALQIVREIPTQDLFITLKEVGLNDGLELLELISPEQFQNFLDLDGWHKGHLDSIAIGNWFSALSEASLAKAVQIFSTLDVELISLLLKMYANVYDTTLEEEPADMGLAHSITPDGRYIIVFEAGKSEESLIQFLKQALDQLYQRNLSFILRLIENVRWETQSMLEEEALKFRDGRMQDLGFAPLNEEKEILSYIDPSKHFFKDSFQNFQIDKPVYSILLKETKNHKLLQKALENTPEALQKRVFHELIATANRVHVAFEIDLGDVSALQNTVQYTINTIEITLAYLSKGEETKLKNILNEFSLKKLFQLGRSLSLRLGRDFRKIIADPNAALQSKGLLRLDSPLSEVVAGILLPNPMYYAGLTDPKRIDYRCFETLVDIANTANAISESTFRAYLLGPKGIGVTEEKINELKLNDKAKMPTHGILLATWLCHQILGNKPSLHPLNQEQIQTLKAKLFSEADIERCVQLINQVAVKLVPLPGLKTAKEAQERSSNLVKTVLSLIEIELSSIKDDKIDTKFISTILTKPE